MKRQPADEKGKDDGEDNSVGFVTSCSMQTTSTDVNGHIGGTYDQEWDEESHKKAKNS